MTVYKTSDIFKEDPNTGDVIMQLPDDILAAAGFGPADNVKISVGNKGTLIIEKVEKT
jgi:antitoxin component of MazEF toxin-antitoxin module